MINTSYLIDKFKGIYRLKVPYDFKTKDYNRKLNGTLEDIDVYIDCANNVKIFYYGSSILQAYIPSLQRGHNIIKAITDIDSSMIFDIEETDSEVLFKFKYVNSDKIIPLLKPKTSGAGISPFSSKNLPKTDYKIPDEDFIKYKNIVSKIPQNEILRITHTSNEYLKSLVTKKQTWEDIKTDIKLKGLKAKEYLHSIGKWDEYIKYLEENL